MNQPIKKIVVVGRDADAWLAALTLQQRFSRTASGVEVELIELPPAVGLSDCYITSPSQKAFHDFLRSDDKLLVKSSRGMHSYGQRFANWGGPAPAFMHAYDRHGHDFNNVSFIQYWLRAKKAGLNVALEEFSFGAVAAKNNRTVVFNEKTEKLSSATYGYNLHALSFIATISKAALALGVKHQRAIVASVTKEGENIKSIKLQSGESVTANFFVDASGAEARLIRELEHRDNYCSWKQWFPCDRKVSATAKALSPVPSFSHIAAFKEGWLGLYPLLNSTAITAMYSSGTESLDETLSKISTLSGVRLENVEVSEFDAGYRTRSWIGNCCALGSSSAMLEQLDATDLHVTHMGILYLSALFPVADDFAEESQLFNKKVCQHVEAVRDFQLAHYALNDRKGEPLWDKLRSQQLPESLKKKIALFKSCGRLSMNEVELFQEENWASIFIGHQLIPEKYDPLVDRMSEPDQIEKFQVILKYIASEVDKLPTMQTEVEMNTISDRGSFF